MIDRGNLWRGLRTPSRRLDPQRGIGTGSAFSTPFSQYVCSPPLEHLLRRDIEWAHSSKNLNTGYRCQPSPPSPHPMLGIRTPRTDRYQHHAKGIDDCSSRILSPVLIAFGVAHLGVYPCASVTSIGLSPQTVEKPKSVKRAWPLRPTRTFDW